MTGAPELAQEALKFLIHFIGDMHQPLHLSGRDRGGNGDKVHWDNRVTSASAYSSILVQLDPNSNLGIAGVLL